MLLVLVVAGDRRQVSLRLEDMSTVKHLCVLAAHNMVTVTGTMTCCHQNCDFYERLVHKALEALALKLADCETSGGFMG